MKGTDRHALEMNSCSKLWVLARYRKGLWLIFPSESKVKATGNNGAKPDLVHKEFSFSELQLPSPHNKNSKTKRVCTKTDCGQAISRQRTLARNSGLIPELIMCEVKSLV